MRQNPRFSSALWWLLVAALLSVAHANAGDRKFETQLIWATNEKQSPNSNHKAVEPEIRERLNKLPLKWENYFEVNRQQICLDKGGTNKVVMSPQCTVEVNMKEDEKVEVKFIGKDNKVLCRQTQSLKTGKILILGGEAPNSTGWLVTVKRTK